MLSATMRDIAIIIVAIQSMIISVLIAVLVWQIWRLVKIIQTEVRPIIDDTQATLNTVRGTSTFVSENIVEPVIRTTSTVTRWRGAAGALIGELRATGRVYRPGKPSTSRPTSPPTSPPAPSPAASSPTSGPDLA